MQEVQASCAGAVVSRQNIIQRRDVICRRFCGRGLVAKRGKNWNPLHQPLPSFPKQNLMGDFSLFARIALLQRAVVGP